MVADVAWVGQARAVAPSRGTFAGGEYGWCIHCIQ